MATYPRKLTSYILYFRDFVNIYIYIHLATTIDVQRCLLVCTVSFFFFPGGKTPATPSATTSSDGSQIASDRFKANMRSTWPWSLPGACRWMFTTSRRWGWAHCKLSKFQDMIWFVYMMYIIYALQFKNLILKRNTWLNHFISPCLHQLHQHFML